MPNPLNTSAAIETFALVRSRRFLHGDVPITVAVRIIARA
ncbi:hypothetical protein BIFBRE_03148 [Bifidobacterium breve DSM 20213 = JCM 1192]|uniref:Uncharacterized protein n=1 Tax=Bifidobacterium breve DSM 20213 = JCM 1192 TaxID=518634 RepID=D4BM57_BIFBR|nr:hypothetical protein BIFBRE_03148 [Bifidobacterium breve DSM 20213 = JCM 1192]